MIKHKANRDSSKQCWMCENRLCKAYLHSYVGDHEYKIVETISEQNHSATDAKVEVKILKH